MPVKLRTVPITTESRNGPLHLTNHVYYDYWIMLPTRKSVASANLTRAWLPRNCLSPSVPTFPETLTHWGWDKVTPLRRRHFRMHLLEWKCLNLYLDFTEFVPNGPINNSPSSVEIMAWRRPGDKPWSKQMMVIVPTHLYESLCLNKLTAHMIQWRHAAYTLFRIHCGHALQLHMP